VSICLLGVFRLCRVLEIGLDKLGDKLVQRSKKECLWTGFIIVGRTDEKVLRKRLLGV
jgi:hypothetical protein